MKSLCYLYSLLFIIAVLFLLPVQSHAEEVFSDVVSRADWMADEEIHDFKEKYISPERLIVVPLMKRNIAASQEDDIQELYYHFATRSTYGDFPFHFILDRQGTVYEGNRFGAEAQVRIGQVSNAVIVGYLQKDENSFPVDSLQSLKEVLVEIMNLYSIPPEQVDVYELTFSLNNGKLESMDFKNPSDLLQQDFMFVLDSLESSYNPPKKRFMVDVDMVSSPEEMLEFGSTHEVSVTLTNSGNVNIYGSSSNSIYVARLNPFDERSHMYDEATWDSFSRVKLLDKNEKLVVGKSKTFSFNIIVPLYPPSLSEDFALVDFEGNKINGTKFTVTLKIQKPDESVIEVLDTPIGILNVRSEPGIGEIIARAPSGSRYLVLDELPGYYKIEIDGKKGWVYDLYVTLVDL